MILKKNECLDYLNTFGVECFARYYLNVEYEYELEEFFEYRSSFDMPYLVLGKGSNVLFVKDFDGLIIHMNTKGINVLEENSTNVLVKAKAGVEWNSFVLYCIENNYGGIENLSYIPGTVGAAPVQNIGAYGVELSDVFESLTAFDLENGIKYILHKHDCEFGYRDSIFKHDIKKNRVILDVTLKLEKKHFLKLDYADIKNVLASRSINNPTIKDVSDVITNVRKSKLADYTLFGNAGSFFKNPTVSVKDFENLKSKHEDIVGHSTLDGNVKISAANLIEKCGWKGKKVGPVGVYEKHALVLVNYGGASGKDIYDLACDIQKSVKDNFGIAIVPEVNIII